VEVDKWNTVYTLEIQNKRSSKADTNNFVYGYSEKNLISQKNIET